MGVNVANNTVPLYREIQHFRQIWLWIFIIFISCLVIYGGVQQLILGRPFGNNPVSDIVLIIIVVIFGFGFPVSFFKMNLTTEVRSDGLYIRFFPFHLSKPQSITQIGRPGRPGCDQVCCFYNNVDFSVIIGFLGSLRPGRPGRPGFCTVTLLFFRS